MSDSEDDAGRVDAAARWYSVLQDPDVDLETWHLFRAWERDPANAAAFREIEASLALVDAGLRAGRAPAGPSPAAARRARIPKAAWIAALAAVLVLAAAAFVMGQDPGAPAPETYATAVGEQRSVTLADRSVVTLNTDTALDVTYTQAARQVTLVRGQALFEVTKGKRPFTVDAGATRTRALGTAFEVYAQPGSVAVTLLEGSVLVSPVRAGPAVSPPDPDAASPDGQLLSPGDRLAIAPDGTQTLSKVDPGTPPAWQSGMVRFDNVTLAEAVADLNRYSTTKIAVPDPALAAERISGTYHAGKPDEFASNLALFLPVRIERAPDVITLAPADAPAP